MSKISEILKKQKKFSDLFFDSESMTEEERIERHKIFALALHSEVSSLADAVHYKDHRPFRSETQRQKILYETVDVVRYCLATLNLWDIDSEEFLDGYESRESFLWDRETAGIQKWKGQPVVIVDIDDVIARFRSGFFAWIKNKFDHEFDVEDPSYYVQGMVAGMTVEDAYMTFIKEGGIRRLPLNMTMIQTLSQLKSEGFWIHLLTARPKENLKCLYDTYYWLDKEEIPYNSVTLDSEKYRWLADTEFFKQGKVVCAIDDSPKNASEYAQHNVPVFVPKRAYNQEVWGLDNVITYDWEKEDINEKIKRLLSEGSK